MLHQNVFAAPYAKNLLQPPQVIVYGQQATTLTVKLVPVEHHTQLQAYIVYVCEPTVCPVTTKLLVAELLPICVAHSNN
jgi:hypothetical protein